MEIVEERQAVEAKEHPTELGAVLSTLTDVSHGFELATDQEHRGRSRKMVRECADREELHSEAVGHLLRVLEAHDFVVQNGNRWQITETE